MVVENRKTTKIKISLTNNSVYKIYDKKLTVIKNRFEGSWLTGHIKVKFQTLIFKCLNPKGPSIICGERDSEFAVSSLRVFPGQMS